MTPLRTARYFIANLVFRGLILLTMLLPYRWRVPAMGWVVSRLLAPIAGWRRRIRDNLAHVLPDISEDKAREISLAVPDNFGRTLIEIYSGEAFKKHAVAAPVSGPGYDALEEARAEGRPVILVTGHFGNYDAVRAALIARGHNMGALYRPMRNPYFNAHYVRAISQIGEPMFEQGKRGMMQIVKHLRKGGVLGILTDLSFGAGEELDFFGKPALTSLITAELALKYDAALIPVYASRCENGLDFEIIVQAEIAHSDAQTMTQAVNDGLESLVREYPGQWFWIHRRWKARRKPAQSKSSSG
ncbi:lysophospholipid acyltransferase family protein [Lentibacter algarum]|uniref:lysophospholipid acyltransferase family protein n=1 Tax=Lentibacter algarum TaxID=576131 RepID=UPI002091A172|nr:lysophospholipid acyltransferase family protein [Lentibacter algarum]